MHLMRLFAVLAFSALVGVTLTGWYYTLGFNPLQPAWWQWLLDFWRHARGFPNEVLQPAYAGLGTFLVLILTGAIVSSGARSETIFGGRKQKDIHGTARWAETRDVKESGLLSETGVVVGGWPMRRGVKMLRHDGPEHVLAFAPTRSGNTNLIYP